MKHLFDSVPVAVGLYAVIVAAICYATFTGAQAMGYNWQWYRVPHHIYSFTDHGFQPGEILIGLGHTVMLSAAAFVLAMMLGLAVVVLRLSGLVIGGALAVGFLELVRNLPLLVLLYLFYYVLGSIFGIDRYSASVLTLAVFHAAPVSEIFRAGINAIPEGQREAAASIGLSTAQTFRHVVLPQSVSFMLPPLTGEAVQLVKSSAIVSVIAVVELTTMGRNIISDTYMSFEIWFTIAIAYMAVTLILSVGVSYLETRYRTGH